MKHPWAVLLLGTWMLAGLPVHAEKAAASEAVLRSIEIFQKDPSGKDGVAAASVIVAYAEKSEAVHISLSKNVVPWLKGQDAPDADTRSLLLAAYIAGNVRSQLKSGKAEDDVYAGWQQMLATYAQLHQINPTVKFPEVDALKEKETAGTLRAYAAEVTRK